MRLKTLIVGLGHAGRDLHMPCLRRLRPDAEIGAVDCRESTRHAPGTPARWYPGLEHAGAFGPESTVVHVCVPPGEHVNVVETAARLGYRRFIIEKPLASSAAGAARVLSLTRTLGLDVIVVANWLASDLTEYLRALIAQAGTPATDVAMRQTKSRIRVSLAGSGHSSATEVELPHLVALARYLFGAGLEVTGAATRDLAVGEATVRDMGGAELRLRSAAGESLHLWSDLTSPVVERSVRIAWPDGSIAHGFYPCDSRDMYSQVFRYNQDGLLIDHRFFEDDTLARLMALAYAWFEGAGPRPVSDAALHLDVCRILSQRR